MRNTFAAAGTSRSNNFDFLRFTLAVMVMFSHCFPLLLGDNEREPLYRITRGATRFGTLAVAGFFTLSGFLIANSWMNSRGLFDFARRRVLRIYPALVVTTLVTAFLVGRLATSGPFSMRVAARSTAAAIYYMDEPILPNLFVTNPISGSSNGSMWTIWYELWCYALVAAIGLVGILKRPRLVLCCFLFVMAVYVTSDVVSMLPIQPGAVRQLKSIFSGTLANIRAPYLMMFFAAGCSVLADRGRISRAAGCAMAAAIGLIIACFCGRIAVHLAMPVLGVYLLFWIAFNESIPLQRFGANGDFSYGLYLYAWPVTQLLIYLASVKWSPLVLFAATFACTLPLAIASWFLVERPFIQRKKSTGVRSIQAVPKEPEALEPVLALSSREG